MLDAKPKLFVLDTNVILHDCGCIHNFEENDVAIPITVLEELDQFKRGNEDINFQAREFLRRVDALTGDVLSAAGSPLGPGLGSIRIILGSGRNSLLHEAFLQDTPDHRILNTTLALREQVAPRQVILVSKDTNLRMKAKSLGLRAQDYTSDKVESFDKLYTGKRVIEGIDSQVIDRFTPTAAASPPTNCPACHIPLPMRISFFATVANRHSPPTLLLNRHLCVLRKRPATEFHLATLSNRLRSRP